MAELMAYLQLVGRDGRTVELFNGARTMSHLDAGRAARAWERDTTERSWDGQEAWMFNEGDYEIDPTLTDGTANPDPWWDPQDPGTLEVAGFLIDPPGSATGFVAEPAFAERRIGATGVPDLIMSVTGTVVSRTRRGANRLVEHMGRALSECCAGCEGWTARVFVDIPCQDDLIPLITEGEIRTPTINPGAPPPPPGGICDPAPPALSAFAGLLPTIVEDGMRELPGVRFRAMEEIFDQPVFEGCVGNRYRITFDVRSSTWFSRATPVCQLGGLGAWDDCESLLIPFTICSEDDFVDFDCGPETTFSRRRNVVRSARWIRPRCYLRQTCLTPPQPWSVTSRLSAEITNGTGDVYNSSLKVWRAIEGYPDPATDVGARLYNTIEPVWEARIPELRQGERLELDGRTSEVTLHCSNGASVTGGGIVEGPTGSSWQPPSFACDDRHWVALDISADPASYGGLDLSASLSLAREEIVR